MVDLHKIMRSVDPRTVLVHDPGRNFRKLAIVIIVLVGFIGGAAALASTGKEPAAAPHQSRPVTNQKEQPQPNREGTRALQNPEVIAEPKPSRAANFYDPLYVFTAPEVGAVSAYPLADPPGIVINLAGAAEPEEEAVEMVGEDSRIRGVRRRITDGGVRYIIGLKIPVKRINVVHEGSVVIVTPVS